jgi:hypothetical protein
MRFHRGRHSPALAFGAFGMFDEDGALLGTYYIAPGALTGSCLFFARLRTHTFRT